MTDAIVDHAKPVQLTTSPFVQGCSADAILRNAYETGEAELFSDISSNDCFSISYQSSLDDFRRILETTRANYESKSISKVRKWLTAFSSKILIYEAVFDVLAQHHAEYACLAWGALKFVFMGVLNHEKMIKQLAKACCQIADLLPRTDLSMFLYPTELVKKAIAQLYAYIMKFIIHAVRWYKQGKLAHAWTAISKPWELDLSEHVENIGGQARQVEKLAQGAAQAELRDMHVKIWETQQEFQRMSLSLQTDVQKLLQSAQVNQSIQTRIQVDVAESKTMIANIQLSQILDMPFMTALPKPSESLRYCQSLDRRGCHRGTRLLLPDTSQLEFWSSQKDSSFLIMRSSSRLAGRSFTTRLINLIRDSDHRILWALRFPDHWERKISCVDVLRMLFMQALQIDPSALTRKDYPVTSASLREAVSESDWLCLLNRVLRGIPHVYIVIDADLLNHGIFGGRDATTEMLEMLPKVVTGTVMKVFVSNIMIDQMHVTQDWDPERWNVLKTDCLEAKHTMRNRISRQKRRQNGRRDASRSTGLR